MKYIEKISKIFDIDEMYISLILKTIIIVFLISLFISFDNLLG